MLPLCTLIARTMNDASSSANIVASTASVRSEAIRKTNVSTANMTRNTVSPLGDSALAAPALPAAAAATLLM